MRKSTGRLVFILGVLFVFILTMIKITDYKAHDLQKTHQQTLRTESDRKNEETWQYEDFETENESPAEKKTTIGTFLALNGTCFLPYNESESYEYDRYTHDKFEDIQKIINEMGVNVPLEKNRGETLASIVDWKIDTLKANNLQKFWMNISRYEIYPESDLVDEILYDMAYKGIIGQRESLNGTQFKIIMELDDHELVLFKPMRQKREEQPGPNQVYFTEYERHNAEIAAFHVDRVLGSRRAMPVVGRKVNIISDIIRHSPPYLTKTVFVSPQNNVCFYGNCKQYCDPFHPICGERDQIEGSLCAFFPDLNGSKRTSRRSPWTPTYIANDVPVWETNPDYCEMVKSNSVFQNNTLLMELIELSIFDFLIGNADRHNYQSFGQFGPDSFVLRYDHGRAFGRAFHDELRILAPFLQCCMIEPATVLNLLKFHNGPKLSKLVRESMAKDPLSPVLWEPHLEALDRRLSIALQAVRDCIRRKSIKEVFVDKKLFKSS